MDRRLDHALQLINELLEGNTGIRGELSGRGDKIDSVIAGINSLVEAFSAACAERDAVEAALAASEAQWRSLVTSTPDIILTVTPDYRITFVNHAPVGLTPQETIGTEVLQYITRKDRETVRRSIDHVFATGDVDSFEVVARGPHDQPVWFATRVGPLKQGDVIKEVIMVTNDSSPRKTAERDREAILTNIPDVVFRCDNHGYIEWVSESARREAGYDPKQVIGSFVTDFLVQPAEFERLARELDEGAGRVRDFETRLRRSDGTALNVAINCTRLHDVGGRVSGYEGVIRNVTTLKRAMDETQTLNRLYGVLSEVNKAIVRCGTREELLQAICRILVGQGGFGMAWFGFIDEEATRVSPVASAGDADGYLSDFVIHLNDALQRQGPTASAIVRGRYVVVDDIATDPRMAPWRDRALSRGLRSVACFPIQQRARTLGTLNVYAPEPRYFNPDNVQLLCSLADDVSYALDALATRTERMRAMASLSRAYQKLALHIQQTPLAVIEFAADMTVRQWNPAGERIFGFAAYEMVGRSIDTIVPDESRQALDEVIRKLRNKEGGDHYFGANVRKNGARIWCDWHNTALHDGENLIGIISLVNDVTELVEARDELTHSRERLRRLTSHMESLREEERARIAREIHDDLGGSLAAIKMDSRWLKHRFGADRAAATKLAQVGDLVDSALDSMRRIITELRPALLDDLGLTAAIEWQLKEFGKRTGMETALTDRVPEPPDAPALSWDGQVAVFRILQEALNNVMKHAEASRVEVMLSVSEGCFEMAIEDDGIGIAPDDDNKENSFGLLGMRERALRLGGAVSIGGGDHGGTRVHVAFPLQAE